jgi:trigger factor
MKTTCEKTKTSVKFSVEFDQKDFEPARLKALERLARGVKIPGFRNGKAPANVVEQHVDANRLAETTLDILIRTTIPKIYTEEKLNPISVPHVDIKKFVPGEMAEVEISSDIMPEVKLGDYKKLKADYHERKIEDADVEDVLNRIAQNTAESKVVKRAAKEGDDVIIDFCGKKDGVAFDGGTAKDYRLRLGSKMFIPGFEEGVAGHEVGDKFNLNLTFPKEYGVKDLAGQKVVFEVLLKQVSEVVVPAIDDELAQKIGAFETIEALRKDIREHLEAQANHDSVERYKDDIFKEIVESSKTEVPESILEENIKGIKSDLTRNLKTRGLTHEEYLKQNKKTNDEWEADVKEAATMRVKSSIVANVLADELKVEITDEEVEKQVKEMGAAYRKNPEAVKQLNDPQTQNEIRSRMRINRMLDKLVEINKPNAKVVAWEGDEKKPAKKAAKKSK